MRKTNKKGAGGLVTVAMVAIIAVFGLMAYVAFKPEPKALTAEETTLTEAGAIPAAESAGITCPSDKTVDFKFRVLDGGASTVAYLAGVKGYLVPDKSVAGNKATWQDAGVSSGTTGDFSTAITTVPCDTEIPVTYDFYIVTNQSNYQSAQLAEKIVVTGNNIQKTVTGKKAEHLEYRVKDLIDDVYFNITWGHGLGKTIGIFVDANTTSGSTKENITNQNGYTSLTIDADEYLWFRLEAQANKSKEFYGEDDLRTILCVDASTAYWEEPTIKVDGVTPVVVKKPGEGTTLYDSDQSALADYEYCYSVGAFSNSQKEIEYKQYTADNVNPGTSNRVTIIIVTEGRYKSNKLEDTILVGAYQDDSGNSLVGHADYFEMEPQSS